MQRTIGRFLFATLLVTLGTPPPAAAIDLSGDYVGFNLVPFTVTVTQAGTSLQVTGHVVYNTATFPVSVTGTVDPATGAFSFSGAIETLCADFAFSGTGDGEELTGNAIAHCVNGTQQGPFQLTKCGNGVIDPLENCDPGSAGVADCCSPRCRLHPAGTVCTGDGDDCTADVCSATGTCTHLPLPPAACGRAEAHHRTCTERLKACRESCSGDAPARRQCRAACAAGSTCGPGGARIRTLAYVVSSCTQFPDGRSVGHQALRIRRGDRDPVTIAEFGPGSTAGGMLPYGMPYCEDVSSSGARWGSKSTFVFPLQRLGVSPDGSVVVFEVNDEFSVSGFTVPPERKGMFLVHADGRGLTRLGPPSHERSSANEYIYSPPIGFSPDGRRIVFTDRGPGPQGEEAPQIVMVDLATPTYERRTLTRLPAGLAPPFGTTNVRGFLTCCPTFLDDETVLFQTWVDPAPGADGGKGLNPDHEFASFTVRIDGSGLTRAPLPVEALTRSQVDPTFGIAGLGTDLIRFFLHGTPVQSDGGFPISEVFLHHGKELLQLTNFRLVDTFKAFLTPAETRAYFVASADPFGTNPSHNCQMFSVDNFGAGMRQITFFDPGTRAKPPFPACFGAPPPWCTIGEGYFRVIFQDPVTRSIVFQASCNPLGANPNGGQIFAMRPDGSGLRQLTDAAGIALHPDGTMTAELVSPFAYSATLH
jgi:cysteine-rich repeat protein